MLACFYLATCFNPAVQETSVSAEATAAVVAEPAEAVEEREEEQVEERGRAEASVMCRGHCSVSSSLALIRLDVLPL